MVACKGLQLWIEQPEVFAKRLIKLTQLLHCKPQRLRLCQPPRNPPQHLLHHRELTVRTQPIIRRHVRRNLRQPPRQLRLGRQHAVHLRGEALQRLVGIQRPVPRQAVVEKHIEDDSGIAPASQAEARQCLPHQRVAVGKTINRAVQLDRRFDLRAELALQAPFDEVAIETAQQLRRKLAAQVQMCEIIHGAQSITADNVSL